MELEKQSEDTLKELVFNKYFEKKVTKYATTQNKKNVDISLDFIDGRLVNHFNELHKKYGFKRSRHDLQSEYIYQTFVAINKFEPEGDNPHNTWIEIIRDENEHEENKLIKYIKTTVAYKMYEFANPNAFRTTTTIAGKRVHYTLVMEMESLDSLLSTRPENEDYEIQLSDENLLFDSHMYNYYTTFFQKWFDERREDILTKSQVKLLEDLKRCAKDTHLTAEDFEKETGVRWENYSRRLRAIENRISKAWEEENPTKQSRRQVDTSPQIKYFQEYMDIIADDSNLSMQNLQLTNKLVEGMKDKKVEYEVFQIINKSLHGDQLIEFNRITNNNNFNNVPLTAKSLYQITMAVEDRLERLEKEQAEDTPPTELRSTVTPVKEKKKRKRTQLITYNKHGQVTKHEYKLVKEKTNHKNIFFILPTGAISKQK